MATRLIQIVGSAILRFAQALGFGWRRGAKPAVAALAANRRGPLARAPRVFRFLIGDGDAAVVPNQSGSAWATSVNTSASALSFTDNADPRVERMRRAAVLDIFDRVGLSIVPGQFWRYHRTEPDPGKAVTAFLQAIGIVADSVRRGNPDEVDRANDVLSLLVDVDRAFDHVSDQGQQAIEDAIFSGDYDRVREASRIVATYQAILDLGARWAVDDRPKILRQFLADIEIEAMDPLASTFGDAEQADAVAATLDALTRRMSIATHAHGRLRDRLHGLSRWLDWPDADADAVRLLLARFDATTDSLRSRIDAVPDAVAMLDQLEAINADIAELIASRENDDAGSSAGDFGSGGNARDKASASGASVSELDTALHYFCFDVGHLPTAEEFKRRRRELEKQHHPSQPTGSDAAFKRYGFFRDLLMRHFGFAR